MLFLTVAYHLVQKSRGLIFMAFHWL